MIKKLPVLYQTSSHLYNEVEIKKPSGKVLLDTQEAIRKYNSYVAMKTFVAGCTIRIISETNEIVEESAIKRSFNFMSNKNLEYLAQEIMILYYDGEDFVEGVYTCPRCNTTIIAQKILMDDLELDERDRISDLKVTFMEDPENLLFTIILSKPVTIETTLGEEDITELLMSFPTIEDYVKAYSSVEIQNETKLQYAVYANAIKKVNNKDVDDAWRRLYGLKLFYNIEEVRKDIGAISSYINNFGVHPEIQKTCKECGKIWYPFINTLNFFDSVLQ